MHRQVGWDERGGGVIWVILFGLFECGGYGGKIWWILYNSVVIFTKDYLGNLANSYYLWLTISGYETN